MSGLPHAAGRAVVHDDDAVVQEPVEQAGGGRVFDGTLSQDFTRASRSDAEGVRCEVVAAAEQVSGGGVIQGRDAPVSTDDQIVAEKDGEP